MTNNSSLAEKSSATLILVLRIWDYLSRRRRNQLCLLLIVMLVSGAVELVSLGAVLPFLAVLSSPEQLWQKPLVNAVAVQIGYTEASDLVIPITILFAMSATIAALIRLSNLWLNGRLAAAVGSDLSCESYLRTLYQPYEVHLQRNSSTVITATTTQIGLMVSAISSFLQLITSTVVSVGLFAGLIIIDAKVAISASFVFASAYLLLVYAVRRELHGNSNKIAALLSSQLKSLQEGLGAIREVLLDGTQPGFYNLYQNSDRPLRRFQAKNIFLAIFPRYALEATGMAYCPWMLVGVESWR